MIGYEYQCFYEACESLIWHFPVKERFRHVSFSMTKLRNSNSISEHLRAEIEAIMDEVDRYKTMDDDALDALATKILSTFAKICVTTDARRLYS